MQCKDLQGWGGTFSSAGSHRHVNVTCVRRNRMSLPSLRFPSTGQACDLSFPTLRPPHLFYFYRSWFVILVLLFSTGFSVSAPSVQTHTKTNDRIIAFYDGPSPSPRTRKHGVGSDFLPNVIRR